MFAHTFLAVTTAACRRAYTSTDNPVSALIMLTVNEFRRLFVALLLQPLHAVADGGDDTKPEPAPATTADNINNNDRSTAVVLVGEVTGALARTVGHPSPGDVYGQRLTTPRCQYGPKRR